MWSSPAPVDRDNVACPLLPRSMDREAWNRRYATAAFLWTVEAKPLSGRGGGEPEARRARLIWPPAKDATPCGWLVSRWDVAVDFAEAGLWARGRRLAAARGVVERIRYEVADLRAYPPDAQGFDLSPWIYLQIPQAEPVGAHPVARGSGGGAPGGTFAGGARQRESGRWLRGGPQDPAVLYNGQQVVAALGDQLAIDKAQTVERTVETADGTRCHHRLPRARKESMMATSSGGRGTDRAPQFPPKRGAMASLSLAMLLSSLGTSIANVALPTLAQSFGASFQSVQWVVLAYLLAITCTIVGVGRLGDVLGRRRLMLAGIAVFAGASVLCGVAPTPNC
ncbi:MAG: MFS transporter [Rhodocyclaceae bacterium]